MATGKVLVVDDEAGIRDLFVDVLSRKGYEVEVASDGYAGVARAQREAIAMAFLDIRMPGIDGVDTLEKLKETQPGMKIAMMTGMVGSARNERIVKALEMGASICLCKPFGVNDILSTVEMLKA